MIIDKRFYGKGKPLKLSKLIKKIKTKFPKLYHSEILKNDFLVNNFSTIDDAFENDLVFFVEKNCGSLLILIFLFFHVFYVF